MKYVYEDFVNELKKLYNRGNILIVPLGRAVEEALYKLCEKNIISEKQILKGFPHPSGANVNRIQQLEGNKEEMKKIIENIFKI